MSINWVEVILYCVVAFSFGFLSAYVADKIRGWELIGALIVGTVALVILILLS